MAKKTKGLKKAWVLDWVSTAVTVTRASLLVRTSTSLAAAKRHAAP